MKTNLDTPGSDPSKGGPGLWRGIATRLGLDLRGDEWKAALLLFVIFFLLVTFQYATKSVRQSTFVKGLGAANLPWVYLAVALVSYPLLRIYSYFADRVQRHQLSAAICCVVSASMVLFWWLFQFPWRWVPFVLYVWIAIAYVMNVSQFWSFSNSILNPRQAKRMFGFIGAGGLLGGVAGGQLAGLVSSAVETRTNFLVAAAILLLAGVLILMAQRVRPPSTETLRPSPTGAKLEKAKGGLETIKSSKQLQLIAGIMMLTVIVAQVIDIPFNWMVQESTTALDNATRFFGNFYSIMNVAAFIFQILFTTRIHSKLGVGIAMRVLPITVALGTTAVLAASYFMPRLLLGSVLGLKTAENGLRYSLDQSTRELLFFSVPPQARLKGKAFIDVFVQRGAKGVASLLLLPVTPAIGWISPPVLAVWFAYPLIAVWLIAVGVAYRHYILSFRDSLKHRRVNVEVPINLSDVTTLELIVHALSSSDRRQVLQSLELLSSNNRSKLVPPFLLYHDDAEVRQKTLEVLAKAGRVDALPLVERALGDDNPDVRAEAIEVLAVLHGEDACDLMLPRLSEKDPGVRAAALACIANQCGEAMVAEATKTLGDLLSDDDPGVRAEAAKAMGAIREPRFQERLIQLLYDKEPRVVQEAISAIRRRVARDGFNPLYVPTLVSLLRTRRVKHDVREALVAFGEPAIPALTYFMGDTDESVWVRRALPVTIAKIGTLAAANALTDCLAETRDEFQRRKVIAALGSLPEDIRKSVDSRFVQLQIHRETEGYLQTLVDLHGLGLVSKGQMKGPCVDWDNETLDPSLVDKLLGERLEDHLRNLFGLIAITQSQKDVWAAYRSLVSGKLSLRIHALEYLDNTLTGEMRKDTFAVIDDLPLEEKVHLAERQYGSAIGDRVATLDKILRNPRQGGGDENHLALAALYTVHTDRISELYSRVESLLEGGEDPFLDETASWVAHRIGLAGT